MIRTPKREDRDEWFRLRIALWTDESVSEHLGEIDAFFDGTGSGRPPLAAVFVSEVTTGVLNGFLELSVRDYAEGCAGPTPYIEGWYVDSDVRGQGIGRALVQAAEAWAREHGYTEIASDAELENLDSLRAHAALGFEEVERAIHFRKAL